MAATASPYGFKPVRMLSSREAGGSFPTESFPIKYGNTSVIPYGSPVVLTAPANIGTVTTVAGSGLVATLTFSGAHGLVLGQVITVTGVTPSAFNGVYTIASVPSSTTLTYAYAGGAYVSGTATVNANGGFLALPTDGGFNSLGDHYIGIFVGCAYLNAQNSQPQWDQWYPGSVNSYGMVGHVVTDPEAVFQVQANYASADALSNVGYSYKMVVPGTPYTTGTKDSTITLDIGPGSSGTATNYPWKVVGVSRDPNNTNATGYVDVLVKAQSALHVYERAL